MKRTLFSMALLCLTLAACGIGTGSGPPPVDLAAPPDLGTPTFKVKDGLASAPELLVSYAVTGTGLRFPTGLYNVTLRQACSPGRTGDQRLRCLPVNRALPSDYFVDTACLNRLYSGDPECGGAVYIDAPLGCGQVDLYPANLFDPAGLTYIFQAGACRNIVLPPELRAKVLYTRGARLPESTFPALDEAVGGG